jgi:O-antigen/teichoic acid export membrane protein
MSILKNASYLLSAQVLNLVIGFISSIYSTRLLGPEGRGMSAIFNNGLTFIILFFSITISSSVVYFVNSGKLKLENLLSSLLLFSLFSTALVFLSLVILKQIGYLGLTLPEGYQTYPYILLITFLYFNKLVNTILVAIMTAQKEFKYQSMLFLVPGIVAASVYICVFYFWFELSVYAFELVVAVTSAMIVINLVMTISVYAKVIGRKPAREMITWNEFKEVLTFSLFLHVGNVLNFLIMRMDYWFIDAYWGKAALGIYAVASQLAQLIAIFPSAVNPMIYSYSASMKDRDSIEFIQRTTNITLYACVLFSIAETILVYFFVTTLYGEEFVEAKYIMPLLLVGVLPFVVITTIGVYFSSNGRSDINLRSSVASFLVCLILYPLMTRAFSVYGAAAASAIAYSVRACVMLYFAKIYGLSIKNSLSFTKTFGYIKELMKTT